MASKESANHTSVAGKCELGQQIETGNQKTMNSIEAAEKAAQNQNESSITAGCQDLDKRRDEMSKAKVKLDTESGILDLNNEDRSQELEETTLSNIGAASASEEQNLRDEDKMPFKKNSHDHESNSVRENDDHHHNGDCSQQCSESDTDDPQPHLRGIHDVSSQSANSPLSFTSISAAGTSTKSPSQNLTTTIHYAGNGAKTISEPSIVSPTSSQKSARDMSPEPVLTPSESVSTTGASDTRGTLDAFVESSVSESSESVSHGNTGNESIQPICNPQAISANIDTSSTSSEDAVTPSDESVNSPKNITCNFFGSTFLATSLRYDPQIYLMRPKEELVELYQGAPIAERFGDPSEGTCLEGIQSSTGTIVQCIDNRFVNATNMGLCSLLEITGTETSRLSGLYLIIRQLSGAKDDDDDRKVQFTLGIKWSLEGITKRDGTVVDLKEFRRLRAMRLNKLKDLAYICELDSVSLEDASVVDENNVFLGKAQIAWLCGSVFQVQFAVYNLVQMMDAEAMETQLALSADRDASGAQGFEFHQIMSGGDSGSDSRVSESGSGIMMTSPGREIYNLNSPGSLSGMGSGLGISGMHSTMAGDISRGGGAGSGGGTSGIGNVPSHGGHHGGGHGLIGSSGGYSSMISSSGVSPSFNSLSANSVGYMQSNPYYRFGRLHTHRALVKIPNSVAGSIIGRAGSHIQAVEQSTDTRVELEAVEYNPRDIPVSKDISCGGPARYVTIYGSSPESVQFAEELIEEKVRSVLSRESHEYRLLFWQPKGRFGGGSDSERVPQIESLGSEEPTLMRSFGSGDSGSASTLSSPMPSPSASVSSARLGTMLAHGPSTRHRYQDVMLSGNDGPPPISHRFYAGPNSGMSANSSIGGAPSSASYSSSASSSSISVSQERFLPPQAMMASSMFGQPNTKIKTGGRSWGPMGSISHAGGGSRSLNTQAGFSRM